MSTSLDLRAARLPETPAISVVIPFYNAQSTLAACLESLYSSDFRAVECILVDDGSTDESAKIAARYPARTIQTSGRRGPAHARNLGAQQATAPLLLFIDADVCIHPDAIQRIVDLFRDEANLTAVIGSYDYSPGDPGFLSQYRNLLHAFYHSTGKQEACTFWGGCGAIVRETFLHNGGFSESYSRPSIEDIELGYRLKRDGYRLMLDPNIQVKHLKVWTLWGMIRTDVFDRAIPWTELILRHRRMPDDLNIQKSQRLSVTLVFLMALTGLLAAIVHRERLLVPAAAVLFAVLNTYWIERASRRLDVRLMLAVGLFGAGLAAANLHPRSTFIFSLLAACYFVLMLRYFHAYEDQVMRRASGLLYGCVLIASIVFILKEVPFSYYVAIVAVMLSLVLLLNHRLYSFLAQHWGRLYALAAIPFHILYYIYSGLAFLAGIALYLWNDKLRPLVKPGTAVRPFN